MKCPQCGQPMRVQNTYDAGTHVKIQRLRCASCLAIVTAKTELVNINPGYGNGAAALARRQAKEKPPDLSGG